MAAVSGKEKRNVKTRRKASRKKSVKNGPPGSQKTSSWEEQREKQKLFKQLEIERAQLEKEKRNVKSERAEVQKKRELYLEEKEINDRLAMKYETEKGLWLTRKKKKGHNFNKQYLLDKVARKIKEWETKTEEAKQEWINIETDKAEMKELDVGLGRDQEQLKNDREELERQIMEYEEKSKTLEDVIKANDEERDRLQVLQDPLLVDEKNLDERIKNYEVYDSNVRDRENVANHKEEEQSKEGARLESVKQNLFTTLEKRKTNFNQQELQLYEVITKMDATFADLFDGVGEKVEESIKATVHEASIGGEVFVEQEAVAG